MWGPGFTLVKYSTYSGGSADGWSGCGRGGALGRLYPLWYSVSSSKSTLHSMHLSGSSWTGPSKHGCSCLGAHAPQKSMSGHWAHRYHRCAYLGHAREYGRPGRTSATDESRFSSPYKSRRISSVPHATNELHTSHWFVGNRQYSPISPYYDLPTKTHPLSVTHSLFLK